MSPAGLFVARPDGWIDDVGIALEVDSAAHHFLLDDWERTQQRALTMASYGALVVSMSPRRIRDEPHRLLREIETAYQTRAMAGHRSVLRILPR